MSLGVLDLICNNLSLCIAIYSVADVAFLMVNLKKNLSSDTM